MKRTAFKKPSLEHLRQRQKAAAERALAKRIKRETDPEYIEKVKKKGLRQYRKETQLKVVTKNEKTSGTKKSSLKGRAATAHEKEIGDKIASLGCICCRNQGLYTSEQALNESIKYVSLHHIQGRQKKYCHYLVLPLCQWHHDIPFPGKDHPEVFPIHAKGDSPGKKVWVEVNGSEVDLLLQCYEMIGENLPFPLEMLGIAPSNSQ